MIRPREGRIQAFDQRIKCYAVNLWVHFWFTKWTLMGEEIKIRKENKRIERNNNMFGMSQKEKEILRLFYVWLQIKNGMSYCNNCQMIKISFNIIVLKLSTTIVLALHLVNVDDAESRRQQ